MKRQLQLVAESESSPTRCSIPEDAACHSGLLERILRHDSFREAREGSVRLPLDTRTVRRLGAFLREEQELNGGGSKARRTEFHFSISAAEVLELLHAAYYTETWALHALCSRMLLTLVSEAESLSLEGLSEHALLLLCRSARPEQLCVLEDKGLVSVLTCMREWMRRPPVALPGELVAMWEEPRCCGARNDYASLQYWLCGSPSPEVTRAVLRPDTPSACLTKLTLVCCFDPELLSRLGECTALRGLVLRPDVRPAKALLLPAAVCARLSQLEVSNARLSKKTPSLLRLQELWLCAAMPFPRRLHLDFLPPSLLRLTLADTGLAASELGLASLSLSSLSSLALPGSRVGAVRLGSALMPDGSAALGLLRSAVRLTRLDLSRSNIHDDLHFRRSLELVAPTLEELDLSDNKLQVWSLHTVVRCGRRLKRLSFAGNRIGTLLSLPEDAECAMLARLDVSQNCVPPAAAEAFVSSALARFPKLSELCMARQSSWTREYVALRDQFRHTAAVFDPIDLESEDQIPLPEEDDFLQQ